MLMETIPIHSIFGPTIQGEGVFIGRPAVFVRVAGCDGRCSWCDTTYARDVTAETPRLSALEIVAQIDALPQISQNDLVVLTGGNPMMYPQVGELVQVFRNRHRQMHVETQGTIFQEWIRDVAHVTISPKMLTYKAPVMRKIAALARSAEVKVVIFGPNEDAYSDSWTFLDSVAESFYQYPLTIQIGNPYPGAPVAEQLLETYRRIVEHARKLPHGNLRILPQMQTLLWLNRPQH